MSNTRPVIFISAVTRELHTARDLVAKTLLSLGYEPKWQDIAPTDTGDLRAILRQRIDTSDAVLQLVGHCYGFAPNDPDPTFGPCSYTQYEALHARQQGKPVHYILTEDAHPTDGCASEPQTLQDLQENYRQTVKACGDLYHSTSSLTQTELLIRRLKDDLAELRKEAQRSNDLLHQKSDQLLDQQQQTNAALADLRHQFESFIKGGSEQRLQQDYDTLLRMVAARHQQTPEALVAEMRQRACALLADPGVELQTKVSALREAGEFIKARDFAIESAQHLASLRQKATRDEAQMWTEASRTELTLGHYAASLQHAETAVCLTSPGSGSGFLVWSAARHQQGRALRWLRKDKEAQALYEELIPLQQAALGSDHLVVLQSRRLLAAIIDDQGDYALAEQQDRALVADCQRVLGAEHYETLANRNNLAIALRAQGRHAEAEQEHRAVLQLKERVLGADHPSTLASRNNLANALQSQGRHAAAEQEHRAVLQLKERMLGTEHPDTLGTRMNLGGALRAQGKHAEAEHEYRKSLEIKEHVLGAEHPEVARSCYNLALCLEARQKLPEALELIQRADQWLTKALGPDHPHTQDAKAARERIESTLK